MIDSSLQRRQLRLPSLFLLVMVVTVFMATSAGIAWHLYGKPYDDLPTFYWATHLAFSQGLSAYQPVHFQEMGQLLSQKIYPFLYPPPSLLLFSPTLFCVDYEQCKMVFSVLNLLLWWMLAWVLCIFYLRCAGIFCKQVWVIVVILLFALLYAPLIDTLKNGQINLVVLLCLMPTLLAPIGRWRRIAAGFLLACAIILKVYVLLLLPVMLIFGRWREVVVSVSCLALLVVMSVALLPQPLWQEWFELIGRAGYGKGIPHLLTIPFNQSINGFFIRHFLDQRGAGQTTDWVLWIYGVVLACVILVMYHIFKYLRHWSQGCSVALALVLVLINLIAPLTWLHHYVFALPAIIWIMVLLQQAPRTRQNNLAIVILLIALGALAAPYLITWGFAGVLSWPQPGKGIEVVHNLLLSIPLLGAAVLFLLFLRLSARRT